MERRAGTRSSSQRCSHATHAHAHQVLHALAVARDRGSALWARAASRLSREDTLAAWCSTHPDQVASMLHSFAAGLVKPGEALTRSALGLLVSASDSLSNPV